MLCIFPIVNLLLPHPVFMEASCLYIIIRIWIDNIRHPFMKKTLSKVGIEWTYLDIIKIMYKGGLKKTGICLLKNCVFILTSLKFSHLQSALHLMQYIHWDIFSTAQSSFWIHRFWCLLVPLSFFVSPLPYQQDISLWGLFFTQGNKKKSLGMRSVE